MELTNVSADPINRVSEISDDSVTRADLLTLESTRVSS